MKSKVNDGDSGQSEFDFAAAFKRQVAVGLSWVRATWDGERGFVVRACRPSYEAWLRWSTPLSRNGGGL